MSVRDILAASLVFRDLDPAHLDRLASCAQEASYPSGSILASEGEPADASYLLVDGDVIIEVGGPQRPSGVIETLHGGDLVGWSWLLDRRRWLFDAVARTSLIAVRLDGRCLQEAMEADHDFGYELFRKYTAVITERLRSTRFRLMDVYGDDR